MHTNAIEGFWRISKRGIVCSFHKVSRSTCRCTPPNFNSATITVLTPIFSELRTLVHDAEKTAQRQLRAYLVLDQANITRFLADQTIEFQGIIKNTGQTPAYDIDGYTAIMYDAFPLPYPFPTVSTANFHESRSVLGRDQVIRAIVPTKPASTQETIDAIKAGTMAIYVFGRTTYRDAFGISRYTNFRLFYTKPKEGAGLLAPLGKESNDAN